MNDSPHYRPLYRQVYDFLLKQIAEGGWRPGEILPSEQQLAVRLNVSQGTVRKALDTLAVDKLIERRQGKGTFVVEQTQESALFRFFRLAQPGGVRAVPTSDSDSLRTRKAKPNEAQRLRLEAGAMVIEIARTRLIDGKPTVFERIVLPKALFPNLDRRTPLPNALYALYQREYGINITTAEEELHADLANRDDARRLGVAEGSPILHIERVAIGLDGTRAEYRVSRCNTTALVYAVQLS